MGNQGGIVLNPRAFNQRIFLSKWVSAFYLKEISKRGEVESIQIFDTYGDAVLKIYKTEYTNHQEWDNFIKQFTLESLDKFNIITLEHIALSTAFNAKKLKKNGEL